MSQPEQVHAARSEGTAKTLKQSDRIQLEIDPGALRRLLAHAEISVCDFSCLDRRSKQRVQLLMLQLLSRRLSWSQVTAGPV